MDIKVYRKEFLELSKAVANNTGDGTVASFTSVALRNLVDAEVIFEFEQCFFNGVGKRRRKIRLDAYSLDEADGTMNIFITEYYGNDPINILNRADVEQILGSAEAFLDEAINGNLKKEIEISSQVFFLIEMLKNSIQMIRKFRIILLTDGIVKSRTNVFDGTELCKKKLEYQIWDMNRFYKVCGLEGGREPLEIDFTQYCPEGIPCLDASQPGVAARRSYLCAIPGDVLADLYDRFGSRLLESNVRSFLSTKVKVNKDIANTIREEPNMFFVFNNGIASTATEVKIKSSNLGTRLIYANNLQIVNGGQTTASLSTSRYKKESTLSSILVQMKITEVDITKDEKIVQKISKSSNSQNKVSEADFFSSHPFHARMHNISVNLFAKAVGGSQVDTHWYYERTKKQYDQEQSRMTPAKKNEFRLLNPPDQLIEKTNLGTYRNIWSGMPHIASLGPQKNIKVFAEDIEKLWEHNDSEFNELYYQEIVAIAIIHREATRIITKENFYEKGYKPRFVAYSVASLNYFINKNYPKYELDLKQIWNKQELPNILVKEILGISEMVYKSIISDNREIQDIVEWCKREACWKKVKELNYKFNDGFEVLLIDPDKKRDIKKEARAERHMMSGIEAQMLVVSLGKEYWIKLMEWGKERKIFADVEYSALITASKMSETKIPPEWQCQKLANIRERALSEGYQEIEVIL